MTKPCDLSVILTAHDETLVSAPTLRAADRAISHARSCGFQIEPMIVLDRPTPATRDWFAPGRFAGWEVIELDEGDLGRARNRAVPLTGGTYIAFLDADDLFSENWLSEGLAQMRRSAPDQVILHPDINWIFDGASSVMSVPDQSDPLWLLEYFYFANCYDSLCLCPRTAHLNHPYVNRDIAAGYSFQDWQFAVETMAAGWQHQTVPDTVIFKRRRDRSLVTESRQRRAVIRPQEALAIDKVRNAAAHLPANTRRKQRPPAREVPHYGPVMAERIRHASTRRAESRDETACARIADEFDTGFYIAQNPDIRADHNMDPLAHYLRAGEREGRAPSAFFSPRHYTERYADVAESGESLLMHWARTGRAEGRIAAPFRGFESYARALGRHTGEVEKLWQDRVRDLRHRLFHGELGHQVARAEEMEPLIGLSWPAAFAPTIAPVHPDPVLPRLGALCDMQRAARHRRARVVICVNRARWGQGRRIEGHLAHSLAQIYGAGEVLVITTDMPGDLPAGRLPEGVRHVDLAACADGVTGDPRQRLLVEFLRSLRPQTVFNVNSRLLWEALPAYGPVLAAETQLIACLLCNEQTDTGHWTGYPLRQIYRHFNLLHAICTDSHAMRHELISRHALPEPDAARIRVLSAPVDTSIRVTRPMTTAVGGPTVFWAGRFDRQKRPDLLVDIARALPDVRFRAWGETVMGHSAPVTWPDNLTISTPYERFDALPLGEADLWLYTSAWDGVPQLLLEVAMTAIPIVGTLTGGTGEVIADGPGALCASASPDDYAQAIRQTLARPHVARARALRLRAALIRQRSQTSYTDTLRAVLSAGNTGANRSSVA